jgi:hypothetical protein
MEQHLRSNVIISRCQVIPKPNPFWDIKLMSAMIHTLHCWTSSSGVFAHTSYVYQITATLCPQIMRAINMMEHTHTDNEYCLGLLCYNTVSFRGSEIIQIAPTMVPM